MTAGTREVAGNETMDYQAGLSLSELPQLMFERRFSEVWRLAARFAA